MGKNHRTAATPSALDGLLFISSFAIVAGAQPLSPSQNDTLILVGAALALIPLLRHTVFAWLARRIGRKHDCDAQEEMVRQIQSRLQNGK